MTSVVAAVVVVAVVVVGVISLDNWPFLVADKTARRVAVCIK